MNGFRNFAAVGGLTLALCTGSACSEGSEVRPEARYDLVTLGTSGGPVPSPVRSQPASALVRGQSVFLLDIGDGTSGQLAKIGLRTEHVEAIFISHLHYDHTGGLAALMGLRFQTDAQNEMVVYGPPGTQALVNGILASRAPGVESGYAVPGARQPTHPSEQVRVVELAHAGSFEVADFAVTTAENTHYSFMPGTPQADMFKSYAFRFDLPQRSIVYTGDTGPSEAVEVLAEGADILLAEMMDIDWTVETMAEVNRHRAQPLPAPVMEGMEQHLRAHHITAEQVGEMAANAGVDRVIVTHFVGRGDEVGLAAYVSSIAERFSGDAVIASDMDTF
ncbi:MAG TPA: MBL fold metallo-hydrolase [Hyphomonadaceae bacterium]|nr:MBL fold metallo-hydrolase [Hyphomonadaceae bacterium]